MLARISGSTYYGFLVELGTKQVGPDQGGPSPTVKNNESTKGAVANTIQSSGSLASALNKVMPKADDAPEYAIVRRGRNRNAEVKTQDAAKTPMTMYPLVIYYHIRN